MTNCSGCGLRVWDGDIEAKDRPIASRRQWVVWHCSPRMTNNRWRRSASWWRPAPHGWRTYSNPTALWVSRPNCPNHDGPRRMLLCCGANYLATRDRWHDRCDGYSSARATRCEDQGVCARARHEHSGLAVGGGDSSLVGADGNGHAGALPQPAGGSPADPRWSADDSGSSDCDGGWNVGNSSVFGTPLRPQGGPTGIALLALRAALHEETPSVTRACQYLTGDAAIDSISGNAGMGTAGTASLASQAGRRPITGCASHVTTRWLCSIHRCVWRCCSWPLVRQPSRDSVCQLPITMRFPWRLSRDDMNE